MKYDWLYLCSSTRRLAITLQFLPQDLGELDTMIICYCRHLDPPGTREALLATAKQYAPSWLRYDAMDLSQLVDHCPLRLRKYYEGTGKPRWALGVKLLLPYLYRHEDWVPFLYTDDDVLLLEDPTPLMTNSFGTAGNFKFFKGNMRLASLALELNTAFSRGLEAGEAMQAYDDHIMDAGVFFMKSARGWSATRPYPDDWSNRLYQFSKLPYLASLDPESHEFRRIDQRFLTMFGLAHGWDTLTKAPQRRNCYSHPTKFRIPSLVKGTTFVHYKTGQHKADWMTALETYLLERNV